MKEMKTCSLFYRLLYAGTFSVVILFCFSALLGISDVKWQHMVVLLISVATLSALHMLNGRQWVYVIVLGICVIFFLFWSAGAERCLLFLREVLDILSASDLPMTQYEDLAKGRIYIELGRVLLLVVVCYLGQLLLGKNIFLRMISADVVGGWMLYMWKVPKTGVVFFVLYIGLIVAERIRSQTKKMKNGTAQAFVLGILMFLAVYTGILCFMPMPEKPYDWQWAKNFYRRAEEKITMYAENIRNGSGEYFDGAASGFSEDGDLFSNIIKNDGQLMMLGIGKQKETSVYLTGKIFDTFNGREWECQREVSGAVRKGARSDSGNDINEPERILDVIETVYALRGYTGNLNPTYYRSIRMDVSYRYFHTNYLMAPTKTWIIEAEDQKIKYHQRAANFILDKKAGYGTKYTVQYCQLDIEREELYRFLEWSQNEDCKAWEKVVNQYTNENISIEELYTYREMMKEQYLPKTDISAEAEEWIALVTADAKTEIEKLKYIESALSAMEYNTNPGKLPETVTGEKDFLDYFILEKREGYCAYFATAFVLLARAEGFPSRYVQGFCVPSVSGDETPVYSDMSHAWPEVYIEGKGWIPFEPTPGFAANRYLPEKENTDSDMKTSYIRRTESQTQDDVLTPNHEMTEDSAPEGSILEEDEQSWWRIYAIRVVWILLIGSVFAFMIDRTWEKYREKNRGLDEKYRLAVLHNLQILDLLGYKRKSSETYTELTERIRQRKSDMGEGENADRDDEEVGEKCAEEIPCEFIETYEQYLYGTLEISEQILNEVSMQRARLLETLKKSKQKVYWLYRVRLYIIRYR